MPATVEDRIQINSTADLNFYFDEIRTSLAEKETENSWQRLDKALFKLEAITKGGAYKYDDFIPFMKSVAAQISTSLLSERTKLSGTAADLLNSVAPRLAERFEPLVNLYVPPLLALCARTNKVALKRAEKCLQLIARHCKLGNTLPLFREACKDKFAGLRVVAVSCITLLIEAAGRDKLSRRVADIETSIQVSATDSNPEVRQNSKRLFEVYMATWPDRVESFTTAFTPTIRRYLSLPKTGGLRVDYDPAALRAAKSTELSSSQGSSRTRQEDIAGEAAERPRRRGGLEHSEAVRVQRPHIVVLDPRAEEEAKKARFLAQLASAKAKARMPTNIMSTGALRGLDAADVFGRGDKSRQKETSREVRHTARPPRDDRREQEERRREEARAVLAKSLPAGAESSSSRRLHMDHQEDVIRGAGSTSRSRGPPEVGEMQEEELLVLRPSKALAQSALEECVLTSPDARQTYEPTQAHTAPATPLPIAEGSSPNLESASPSPAGNEQDGEVERIEADARGEDSGQTERFDQLQPLEEVHQRQEPELELIIQEIDAPDSPEEALTPEATEESAGPPSDAIAKRLEKMAQEQLQRQQQKPERAVSGSKSTNDSTPVNLRAASMPARTPAPRAVRVAVPLEAPPPIQRQVSATRVARAHTVQVEKELKPRAEPSTSSQRPISRPPTKAPPAAQANARKVSAAVARPAVPSKVKTMAPQPPAKLTARPKTVSSISQAQTAKSRIIGGAEPAIQAPTGAAAKRPTGQQAREALMLKKQAEVAKMKAAAKARSAAAAVGAAAVAASRREKVNQLKAAEAAGLRTIIRPFDASEMEDTAHEQTVSASEWDRPLDESVPRQSEPVFADDETEEEAQEFLRCQVAQMEVLSQAQRPPATPAKTLVDLEVQPSPKRTPLATLSPNVIKQNSFHPASIRSASPRKTPSKTPSRMAFSSPADNLRRQLVKRSDSPAYSPVEDGTLRMSAIKHRLIASPHKSPLTIRKGDARSAEDIESHQENIAPLRVVPHHILPVDSRDSSADSQYVLLEQRQDGKGPQLICGKPFTSSEHNSDAETDVESYAIAV